MMAAIYTFIFTLIGLNTIMYIVMFDPQANDYLRITIDTISKLILMFN